VTGDAGDTAGVGSRVRDGTDAVPPGGEAPALDSPKLQALRAEARLEPCTTIPRTGGMTAERTKEGAGDRRALPALTLPCLGRGPAVRLSDISGRPVVLNLWAQWCPPCRKEAPHFQALYERAGDRLLVVGVDYDDPQPERALAFVEELGLRYPQLADPDKELRTSLGLTLAGIPATVFIDAEGRVVHVSQIVYPSEQALARDVQTHLGVRT
jgi:cytochrome c biogenesis protein CcmG, thiol:disulfide interchange protein DsbE